MSGDTERLILTGPPSANWIGLNGLAGDIHFSDIGLNRVHIRDSSDPRQQLADFNPQTQGMWTHGSVMIDKGPTIKSVEVVTSETDPTLGLLQAPTIKTNEKKTYSTRDRC